ENDGSENSSRKDEKNNRGLSLSEEKSSCFQKESSESNNANKFSHLRENDTGLGQPDFEPSAQEKEDISSVSADEIDRLKKESADLTMEFEQKLLELEQTGFKLPRGIFRTAMWIMVFLGALCGIFLINQGLRFAAQVSSLTLPWNILVSTAFLFFVGMILLVIFKIFQKLFRFSKLTKIDLKALNLLAQRKRFQRLAEKKKDEARQTLSDYLEDFKIDDSNFQMPGIDSKDREKLIIFRQSLMDKKGYVDSDQWLREFDESFVRMLDQAASKRTRVYTKTVAMGTAASPIKFIDQIIVLYASFKLIGELLQIYNLRPAMGQSSLILSRAIIQAYLSGVIEEQAEAGVESFSDYYENIFGEISLATGISAVSDATRFILPKVSQGALNGFLIWRLARQARKMLRPI
ncbi:MAG: DUF697 domain-containing protein, partial [Desulfonatronovibrio sp.]